MGAEAAKLPIVDLSSPDRRAIANSIRQACVDHGFFYAINHGVDQVLFARVFEESRKFFSLPLDEKLKLTRKEHRGYTALYAENLDPASSSRGDSKESFYIGPVAEGGVVSSKSDLNQWPSQEVLPSWRPLMESYYEKVMSAGRKLVSFLALALDLDYDYFEKIGALAAPDGYLRLLHYPGEVEYSDEETYGASAHSDYGMITLLATDGVPGLQICRDKFKKPQIWEDVQPVNGAFIVNIGDMMERWTNCLFRSTLHRVMPVGQERYSFVMADLKLASTLILPIYQGAITVFYHPNSTQMDLCLNRWINKLAFFLEPNQDCIVECLESCCSASCPKRFPPIRSGDYLKERLMLTYGT